MQPQTPTPESSPKQGQNERLPTPITPEQAPQSTPEVAPAPQESQPAPAGDSANQNAGAPTVPLPQPVSADEPTTTGQSAVGDNTPAIAGDVDLIEKQWVQKAKQVVDQTKDDPHKQNNEMNKVKTGYMKKRYNKEVKIPEEEA